MEARLSRKADASIQLLVDYLSNEIRMPETARQYAIRLREFGLSLGKNQSSYNLCRDKIWASQGLKCATFDKKWVFAFKVQKNGLLVIHHIKLGKLIRNTN